MSVYNRIHMTRALGARHYKRDNQPTGTGNTNTYKRKRLDVVPRMNTNLVLGVGYGPLDVHSPAVQIMACCVQDLGHCSLVREVDKCKPPGQREWGEEGGKEGEREGGRERGLITST